MKSSVEVKMLNILAKKYNFDYQVIYANQSWGSFVDGVWLGSVGYVYNKV